MIHKISDNPKYLSYDMEDRYKMVPPFLRNFPHWPNLITHEDSNQRTSIIISTLSSSLSFYTCWTVQVLSTPHIYHLELLIFCSSMRSNWPTTWEHFRPCFTLCKWTLSQCHDFELLYQVRKIIISVNSYHGCPWMVSSRILQETGAQVQFLTMLNTY